MDEHVYQQLMSSLAHPDSDINTEASLPELLLQNLGEADPKIKAIATYLISRQAQTPHGEEADNNEESVSAEPQLRNLEETAGMKRRASYQRLRRVATTMYAELEDLRERNDILAAALGACYLCWGEDPNCEICRGQGQVGAFKPDKELFGQYVAPLVQSLKAQQQARHGRKEYSSMAD